MREAMGGTWLLGLVLPFIVFFASFLAISINYAKAFNVKNNIVDLISKYEGNNCNSRKKIAEYLQDVGYLVPGKCPTGYDGYGLDAAKLPSGNKAYFCLDKDETAGTTVIDKSYYSVLVFFRIDLPLVGDITTFNIKGETESIYYPNDDTSTSC